MFDSIAEQTFDKNIKKHKKGIDKHLKVCYNIITKKNKTQVSRKEKHND